MIESQFKVVFALLHRQALIINETSVHVCARACVCILRYIEWAHSKKKFLELVLTKNCVYVLEQEELINVRVPRWEAKHIRETHSRLLQLEYSKREVWCELKQVR